MSSSIVQPSDLKQKWNAYAWITASIAIGGSSLLVITLFYYTNSINLNPLPMGEFTKLCFNTLLCLLFFSQHSLMVRKSFREWLKRYISEEFHMAFYSVVSGITLWIVIIFWQKSGIRLLDPPQVVHWMIRALFFSAVIIAMWSYRSINIFDLLGVRQIMNKLRNKSYQEIPFTIKGPYRWVRHPLYLINIMMIWSYPDITLDRLLFNCLWSIWIITGATFEERGLVETFGQHYIIYQQKVPMLIPYRWPHGNNVFGS